MAKKRIVLVRHGKQEKLGGIANLEAPLSKEGEKELGRLVERHGFGPRSCKLWLHSPVRRATESARFLNLFGNWEVKEGLGFPQPELVEGMLARMQAEQLFGTDETDNMVTLATHSYSRTWTQAAVSNVAAVMRSCLGRLQQGEAAMLVSHQPMIHFVRGDFDAEYNWRSASVLQPGEACDFRFDPYNHRLLSCTTLTAY